MSERKRERAKSASFVHDRSQYEFSQSETSKGSEKQSSYFDVRQPLILGHLTALQDYAKTCKELWKRKFKTAKIRKKEEEHKKAFCDNLKNLFNEIDRFKQILPGEITGDDKRSKKDSLEDVIKKFQQRTHDLESNLNETQERLRRAEERGRRIAEEKEDLMTRLSQVAGSKLRDNNPAITDLSDPNRPIKLVEKISELYDNEWTDAMEALERSGRKETEALQVLLHIFTTSYEKCMQIASISINGLQRQLAYPIDSPDFRSDGMRDLPLHIVKQLKDTRKASAEYAVGMPVIIQEVSRDLIGKHGLDVVKNCQKYVDKCIEYSWYMSIQDPPLYIEYRYNVGGKFEHEKMRAYTMSGPYIEYVVWPTIYLHKHGAMLSKAVVQGQSEAITVRAINYGPSSISKEASNWSQINQGRNDNVSSQYVKGYNSKNTFSTPVRDRSVKTQNDVENFTRSVATPRNISNTQQLESFQSEHQRQNISRYDDYNQKYETQRTPYKSTIHTASHDTPRNSTPESWSRHGSGTPPSGGMYTKKGQRGDSQQSHQKGWNTPQSTQISVSPQHYPIQEQDRGRNEGFSQTFHSHGHQQNRGGAPDKLSQTTYQHGSQHIPAVSQETVL